MGDDEDDDDDVIWRLMIDREVITLLIFLSFSLLPLAELINTKDINAVDYLLLKGQELGLLFLVQEVFPLAIKILTVWHLEKYQLLKALEKYNCPSNVKVLPIQCFIITVQATSPWMTRVSGRKVREKANKYANDYKSICWVNRLNLGRIQRKNEMVRVLFANK